MLTSQEGKKEGDFCQTSATGEKDKTSFRCECTCHGVSVSGLRVDKENRKDTVLSGYKALLD